MIRECNTGALEERKSLNILKVLAAVECRAQRRLRLLWLMSGREAMEDEDAGEIQVQYIHLYSVRFTTQRFSMTECVCEKQALNLTSDF